jgi:hypothetical protein
MRDLITLLFCGNAGTPENELQHLSLNEAEGLDAPHQ